MAFLQEALHPRVATLLQRYFILRTPVRTQVAGDITPTIDIESAYDWHPELALYQGWRGFYASFLQGAGGAGNFSRVNLRNTVSSSKLLVCVGIRLSTGAADTVQVNFNTAFVEPVVGPLISPWDIRDQSRLSSVVAAGVNAAAVSGAIVLQASPTVGIEERCLWVLPPGTEVICSNSVANESLRVTFTALERQLAHPNE